MIKKKKTSRYPNILKPKFVSQPVPNLTQEQAMLGEMFGGGDGAILSKGYGEGLPKITHTLTSRQAGDEGTASLFGFGEESERSGV